jgi:hypothetical protein
MTTGESGRGVRGPSPTLLFAGIKKDQTYGLICFWAQGTRT